MIPETIIEKLIWVHVITGTLALTAGAIALIVKKGSTWHKRAGKLFFWSMILSAFAALTVALSPGHQSAFFFSIGIFTLYLITSGYLSLRYKKPVKSYVWDKVVAITMILIAIGMIFMGITGGHINYVLIVFGAVGLNFGIRDMINLRNPEKLKDQWLSLHIGKMTGGFIATLTAFIVANAIIPGLWGWFIPSLIGTPYIVYWNRKISK